MRSRLTMTGMIALLFVCTGHAAGLSIEPGQWEMTSTVAMSMMPQPITTTDTECMEEDEINPEDFNDDKSICQISDMKVDGNTANWSVSCTTGEGQAMTGQWQVISKGTSMSGKGSMKMNYSGQEMNMDITWEGKRTGDC